MSELDDVIHELNKQFGKNTIIQGNDMIALEVPRVSTGSLALDIETGGGLPYGRVVELFGYESTGKSYIASKVVAEAQKQGKNAVWIDAEGTFDPEWATLLGIDTKKLKLARPTTGELAADILEAVIKSGDCGVVVLDSTAALIPEADVDKSMVDKNEQIGFRAQMVNRLVRKITSALNMKVGEDQVPNGCLVIFINQIRMKIGMFVGNPETTPGGLGLKFACSLRIKFKKEEWIKEGSGDNEKVLGQVTFFRTEKNKTYPPYRRGTFDFYVDGPLKGQIDIAKEVFHYGQLAGVIGLTGRTYTIGKEKFVGKDETITGLRSNPELLEVTRLKILDHYFGKKK